PGLQALRILWPFVRPHWRGFILAPLAAISTSAVGLLKPWPFKFVIDDILGVGGARKVASPLAALCVVALSIIAIAVVQSFLSYFKEIFLSGTAQRGAFSLRSALFTHLQRLPLTFHDQQRTGDMITRVTNDVTKVQEVVTEDLLVGGITNS